MDSLKGFASLILGTTNKDETFLAERIIQSEMNKKSDPKLKEKSTTMSNKYQDIKIVNEANLLLTPSRFQNMIGLSPPKSPDRYQAKHILTKEAITNSTSKSNNKVEKLTQTAINAIEKKHDDNQNDDHIMQQKTNTDIDRSCFHESNFMLKSCIELPQFKENNDIYNIPDILSPEYDDMFDGKTPVEDRLQSGDDDYEYDRKVIVKKINDRSMESLEDDRYLSIDGKIRHILRSIQQYNIQQENNIEGIIFTALIEEFLLLVQEIDGESSVVDRVHYKKKIDCILAEFDRYSRQYCLLLEDKNILQTAKENLEKEIEHKNIRLEALNHENSQRTKNLKAFLAKITLFEIPIGTSIVQLLKENLNSASLDPLLKKNYPEFVAFLTTENKTKLKSIENLKKKLDETCKELDILRKENYSSIEYSKKQSNENDSLKSKLVNQEKELFEITSTKIHLDTLLQEKNKELEKLQKTYQQLNEKYLTLETKIHVEYSRVSHLVQKIESLKSQNSQLEDKISSLTGEPSKALKYEKLKMEYKTLSKENYSSLSVESVEQESLVDLQNLVKNLVVTLEIPYYKLSKTIPLLAIRLYSENVALFAFADALHIQLYGSSITHKNFRRAAYMEYINTRDIHSINHPLKTILEAMYNKLIPKI